MATTSKGTIKYKIISRKNPQEPDGAPQYYAKAVQDRSMDFEDFVSHMSDHNSPFSPICSTASRSWCSTVSRYASAT